MGGVLDFGDLWGSCGGSCRSDALLRLTRPTLDGWDGWGSLSGGGGFLDFFLVVESGGLLGPNVDLAKVGDAIGAAEERDLEAGDLAVEGSGGGAGELF